MAARFEDPYRPANNGTQGSYNRAMMQSPSSNDSRPHSNSSVLSERGPKLREDVCIGEEVRISLHLAIERFRRNEEQKELEFPSSLTATERAYVHRYCDTVGLKHKSKGKGNNRLLTVTKKESNQTQTSASSLNMIRNSRQQICNLLQRFPLTTKERQELMPQMERNPAYDANRDIAKATIGKLNNGVAQIPPARISTELDSFRSTLPVFQHKEEIIRSINSNRTLLITGETGSGKTTQIPQMILDDCTANNKRCRILCTQPRRIAALSIAERVSAERGEKIGQTVGYQIRLESKTSPKTLLTFCTNGVLLRTLMNGSHSLSTVTHVIVDEVHERDRFSDFLLTAIRDELSKYPHMKLILMSASMNVDLFIRYFNNCPVLRFPGNLFDVEEHFLEDVLKWTGYTNKKMEKLKKTQPDVANQQKQLSQWCKIQMDEVQTTAHSEEIEEKMAKELLEEGKTPQTADEKEELEPWLVKEMDELLSEIWLTGNEDCFSQLIHLIKSENVSVDYQHSETSLSPLMIAAARGFTAIVEHLLTFGANVKLQSSNDWTALDFAKRFNHEEVIEMLQAYMIEYEMGPSDDIKALDTVAARELSEEEKELLNLYQHSFDDDKVDIELILSLVIKILSTSKEGAVLIFLPGYDDIVTLREAIGDSKSMDKFRYVLYTLHSSMQSNDQKRVFKSVPQGVRKIILATNIAETSITINDVVYVIDSGKVKEKAFDALLSLSMLKSTWISKASALQRKGRAGRCRPGICYHLFSRIRHSMMQDYATPEILRYPLQEICLHTKLIAPIHCPIAEFLAKAPEPPPYMVTRNAVLLLKQIDALDHFEDLTEIGYHLADLPLEPRLGKVVLYSIVLKCLDPVLTIVCALAYKDPFMLPSTPHLKRAADQARRMYSSNTFSDHMTLLRAFQGWQRARTDNCERSYCEKNFLSSASMEMIVGMRTQLLGQLRASGFVRARGGGDIRDLNTNSENWAAVKAALCAGIYPNLAKIEKNKHYKMFSQKSSGIKFHTSSVLRNSASPKKPAQSIPTEWILYEEMSRYERSAYIRCCTAISPITVALFTGPIKLPPESVRDGAKQHAMLHGGLEDSSDSEGEEKEDTTKTTLQFDDWLSFKLDNETASLVLQLRHKWNCLFLRRMKAPSKPWSQVDEAVIKAVISVLSNEEQSLGFQQPAGIGQRPRPMTEYMSAGGGGYSSYDNEDHSSRGRRTPVTPPKKHSNVLPRTPRTPGDNRSGSSSTGSSPKGSLPTTPCSSPQAVSSTPGSQGTSPVKYFVVKPNNQKALDIALSNSVFATTSKSETKFNKAIQDGKEVYLIFSTIDSAQFQGYAKVTAQSSQDKCPDMSGDGLGGTFKIEWMKKTPVPFRATQHICNSWNENKRVQYSKDGQELEYSCGERLIQMLQTFEPKLYEASSDELKESELEEETCSDKASKSSHSEEDKDSLLSDEERSKHEEGDKNSNSRGRYPGHYQGRQQQGYEGQRPGSYPYPSSSQGHQYYHHHQQGYHGGGGGGGGHYNSRMYNMGYPPPMGPNYNPMYMGMHSPPRHPLSSVMILQRGQRPGGHFRGYHPGYGSGYH